MQRIPVLQTARATYALVIANIGTIFGLTWIADILYNGLSYLEQSAPLQAPTPAGRLVLSLLFLLVHLLLYAVAAVVLTRQMLGLRKGHAKFYFSFGNTEWQLILAVAGCLVMTILVMALLVAVGMIAMIAKFPGWAAVTFIFVTGMGVFLFVKTRYLFFLPLTAVLAKDQRLGRSSDLVEGNFWSIVALILCVGLPIFVVHFVLSSPLWMSALADAWRTGVVFHFSLQDFVSLTPQSSIKMALGQSIFRLVLNTALMPLEWALGVGAAVLAYQSLGRAGDEAPLAATA